MAPKRGSHLSTNNKIDIVMFSLFKCTLPSLLLFFLFISSLILILILFLSLAVSTSFTLWTAQCASKRIYSSICWILTCNWAEGGSRGSRGGARERLRKCKRNFRSNGGAMKTTGDDWRLLKGKHFHHCSYRLLLFNYCRSFWTDFKFLEASVGGENKAENKKKIK